jgi:hypothetical protein
LVELPDGERRKILTAWTSLGPEDPYQLLSAKPLLRLEALQELAKWLRLRQEGKECD